MTHLLAVIFGSFFKIGLFTIGGGLVIIPLIQTEMLARGWLTHEQFMDILGIAQATPGPIGVNTATFVGYRVLELAGHGPAWAVVGALVATLSVSAPSVVCVHFAGSWFNRHRERPWMRRTFAVLRPLVACFVVWAGAKMAWACFGEFSWVAAATFAVSFALTLTKRFSPLWGLLFGALSNASLTCVGRILESAVLFPS